MRARAQHLRLTSAFIGLLAGPAVAADAAHPTVVELFQSQGCSSCPPANANVAALSRRPDVLALSFAVTYWDNLGWKDTFATARYTARQWDYAHALGHANVFTPQVVVNGRQDGVGVDPAKLNTLVRTADRGSEGPTVVLAPRTVIISRAGGPQAPTDVWLVRYDPRTVQVAIKRGENRGKTLPHKNIVRELTKIGVWSGSAERLGFTAPVDSAWRTAVILQRPRGGPVVAAATL